MVLESSLNLKKVTPAAARRILEEGAGQKRRLLSHLDLGAGSGSETRVRFFLQKRRFPVRSQVFLPEVGYVDLLVGRSLVVECDSHAHHSDPENDRRRDMAARRSGYTVIRLSYAHIHVTWDRTQEFLLQVLRSRRHLRSPQPLPQLVRFR